ncbi:MAG: hypothetical protein HC809_17010 [Gammaproteobacteria bacterium]|nr:hypothetical protein [Gammaproteobacteria bacterium]
MKGPEHSQPPAVYVAIFLAALAGMSWLQRVDSQSADSSASPALPTTGTRMSPASLPALPPDHREPRLDAPDTDVPDVDVPGDPYPPIARLLDDLRVGSTLRLPDPEGGAIDLRVDAIESTASAIRMRLTNADLPSTVTMTSTRFYATVATPRGVYALSGDSQGTRLLNHAVLDHRNLHAIDYRPPPS